MKSNGFLIPSMSLTGLPQLQLLTNKRQQAIKGSISKCAAKRAKAATTLTCTTFHQPFSFPFENTWKAISPGKTLCSGKSVFVTQLGCFNCLTNYLPNKRKLFSLSFRSFVLRRKMSGFSAVPRRKSSIHSFSRKLFGRELLRKLYTWIAVHSVQ